MSAVLSNEVDRHRNPGSFKLVANVTRGAMPTIAKLAQQHFLGSSFTAASLDDMLAASPRWMQKCVSELTK